MIFSQLECQLKSLKSLLENLNDMQYTQKIKYLGDASIGQHSRHIIELLLCALDGVETGIVDYINRKRDLDLEQNKNLAIGIINKLSANIRRPDLKLELASEHVEGMIGFKVSTTYFREIVYNVEHTIHHLALIKVALIDLELDLVDKNFGMAYSTINYKNANVNN